MMLTGSCAANMARSREDPICCNGEATCSVSFPRFKQMQSKDDKPRRPLRSDVRSITAASCVARRLTKCERWVKIWLCFMFQWSLGKCHGAKADSEAGPNGMYGSWAFFLGKKNQRPRLSKKNRIIPRYRHCLVLGTMLQVMTGQDLPSRI
jgi:hypothetical protein